MKILSEDVFDFSEQLHQAARNDMNWFAYDTSLESVTAREIDVFASEKEANEFKSEKENFGEIFQVLPIDAVSRNVDELIIIELHENDQYPDIYLDVSEVLDIQDRLNFNQTAEGLEELMQSFDWSHTFYDPLYANTEAESDQDKAEHNRLESLIEQMKEIHGSGSKEKELVELLADRYWRDQPMEAQIVSLFGAEPNIQNMIKASEHPISKEVLDTAETALLNGNNWMAYNTHSYLLELSDVQFFSTNDEANQYARDNISDQDGFRVIHFNSVHDILKQIPYGQTVPAIEPSMRTDPDSNPLINKDGNAFTDALIDHIEAQQNLNNKNDVMNENNLKYLKDNVKFSGFGESLFGELEKNLKAQKPEFQLHFTTQINNRPFNATLEFGRSENSEMYFFNGYKASIEKKNGEKVEQSFRLYKGKGVKAKEAYNLLQGRAVFKELTNKDDQPYKAWLQLDFENKDKYENHLVKQYHEKYGYDLKEAVSKFPVLEMDGTKNEDDLLKSLEKGNTQSVTMEINGNPEKMFLEANPQYKTINVYNSELKLMKHEELPLVQGKSKEQSVSQEIGKDNKPEVKQGQKPGASQKANDSLLPKKRTGKKNKMKI